MVGAGGPGCGGGIAGGEDGDPHVLAGAGGQGDGAAHDLVGLAGVDAEADGELDALVELGRRQALGQLERLGRAVELVPVVAPRGVGVLLAVLHRQALLGLTPSAGRRAGARSSPVPAECRLSA